MLENGEKKEKELNYLLKSKNTYSHQKLELWQQACMYAQHASNFFSFWIQYCYIIRVKIESILNWAADTKNKLRRE